MRAKKFNINQDLQIVLDSSETEQLNSVFGFTLLTRENFELQFFITLENVKEYLKNNNVAGQIKSLVETKDYIKDQLTSCLDWLRSKNICVLTCKQIDLLNVKVQSTIKASFYMHGFKVFNFNIYFNAEFADMITKLCQDADNKYVRENYLLFNHRFYFPLLIGKSCLNFSELQSLAVGSVVMLDEKYNENQLVVNWNGNDTVKLT